MTKLRAGFDTLDSSTFGVQGSGTSATQAAKTVSSAPPLLAEAGQRIQSARGFSTAQLSTCGLLKSAPADGQAAAA